MWPKLRDPLMLVALVFLVVSLMLYSMPEPDPAPPTANELADQKAREVAFGVRHRDDAVRLMKEGNYEDALARLKQAAEFDPKGDKSPEVEKMYDDLLADVGFTSSTPASSASAAPRPGAPSVKPSPSPSSRLR